MLGRRYEVDAFEEVGRLDVFCSRCSGWKHIASHCLAAAPKCALCAKDHLTTDHQCPVEGYKMGKGYPCPHGTAKCANCGEAHGAQADACAAKREARLSARGWWSPSPPRREKGAEAPQLPRGMERWARWGPKRGSNPARRVWRSRGPGGEISLCFLFLVCRCGFFFFLCLAELGEKAIREPIILSVFGRGRDSVKGGKMGCCPRGQRQAAAIALRAACSGIANKR